MVYYNVLRGEKMTRTPAALLRIEICKRIEESIKASRIRKWQLTEKELDALELQLANEMYNLADFLDKNRDQQMIKALLTACNS